MSAETANILNIIKPSQEPSANTSVTSFDKEDNTFSKLLGKIESGLKKLTSVQNSDLNNPVHTVVNETNSSLETSAPQTSLEQSETVSEDSNSTNIAVTDSQTSETQINNNVLINTDDSAIEIPLSSLAVNESILANVDFTNESVSSSVSESTVSTNKVTVNNTVTNTTDSVIGASVTKSSSQNTVAKNSLPVVSTTSDDNAAPVNNNASASNTVLDSDAETQSNAVVKASEKVAATAKETAVSQSQDISTKAKETAISNLQSISGTDTTVVESKKGSNTNNNSFSQGSASEQIIKMTLENSSEQSNVKGSENFVLGAEKSVNIQQQNNIQSPKEINKTDVMNQINTKLADIPETGTSKVTIVLKPEHLGRIHLEIVNSPEGITAKMLTDNQQVKDLLDKHLETLKNQLGAQGVNVNNIKVEHTNHSSNNAMDFEREQFEQQFSDNSQNNQTNQNNNSSALNEDFSYDESLDAEAQTSESQIIHDGKVDYKV